MLLVNDRFGHRMGLIMESQAGEEIAGGSRPRGVHQGLFADRLTSDGVNAQPDQNGKEPLQNGTKKL